MWWPTSPSTPRVTREDISGRIFLGRYRLIEKLGEGGMGTVYVAEHIGLGKRCAVKVLGPEWSADPVHVERFLREARLASQIRSPHVIDITDVGSSPDGAVFFAMELLEGEDLGDLIDREGALPWERVQHVMGQVLAGLAAAHEQGILHRDIKPSNIIRIDRDGDPDRIKLLDFGIARTVDQTETGLTKTGSVLGSAEYMSPEQARGGVLDSRSDLYSAGVVMYELLTGRVPFEAETFIGVLTRHVTDPVVPPSEHVPIDDEIDRFVLKALAKDPDQRFTTAEEMRQGVLAMAGGTRNMIAQLPADYEVLTRQRRSWLLPLAIGLSLMLVVGLIAWVSQAGDDGPAVPGPTPEVAKAKAPASEEPTTQEPPPGPSSAARDDTTAADSFESDPEDSPVVEEEPDVRTTSADEAGAAGDSDALGNGDSGESDDAGGEDQVPVTNEKPSRSRRSPKLTRRAVDRVLSRQSFKRCVGAVYQGKPGQRVQVSLVVNGRNGRVEDAQASGPQVSSALGKCVASVAEKAVFPRFDRNHQRVSGTVEL